MVGNFPSTNYVMGMVNVSIFSIFLFGSGFDMTYMLVHPNNVDYLQLLPSDLVVW
jgi:hypothetical protein